MLGRRIERRGRPGRRPAHAYRVRTPERRGSELVIAAMNDELGLSLIATVKKEEFGAESLERPALVRMEQGWRLYVSCATPNSKHWRVDAIEPHDLATAKPRTVFPGSASVGVKDPVVHRDGNRWEAWVCCHPLDEAGEEDRMTTAYATSSDGLHWRWHGVVLSGHAGKWDARGARVTSVLPDGRASYDGRATKEENFSERTGIASPGGGNRLEAIGDAPIAGVRYLDVVPAGKGFLLFFERPRPGGSHDLCVQRDPRQPRRTPPPLSLAPPSATRRQPTRASHAHRSHPYARAPSDSEGRRLPAA